MHASSRGSDLDLLRQDYAECSRVALDLDALRRAYATSADPGGVGGIGAGGDLDALRRGYSGREGGQWSSAMPGADGGEPVQIEGLGRERPGLSRWAAGLLGVFGSCLPVFESESASSAEDEGKGVLSNVVGDEVRVRSGLEESGNEPGESSRTRAATARTYSCRTDTDACAGQTPPKPCLRPLCPSNLAVRRNLAVHEVHAPRAGDESSEVRALLMDRELEACGVDVQLLREDDVGGNPARKAYFSFINPRANKRVLGVRETLEQGARRIAAQVALLDRAYRTRLAEHIRNADRQLDQPGAGCSHPVFVVLDNVRSAYNVGSVFRTAETAACQMVITCGITPHPPHEKLSKTAFSAAQTVPSRHFSSAVEAVMWLKSLNVTVLAMETTSQSRCYTTHSFEKPTALVLGNEISGVGKPERRKTDGLGVPGCVFDASRCNVRASDVAHPLPWGSHAGDGPVRRHHRDPDIWCQK